MSALVFDRFLSTLESLEAFGAAPFFQAMLDFEAALARAQAAEGLIPAAAVEPIVACCRAERFDLDALVADSTSAGSLAIPLVKALTKAVAAADAQAAAFVHRGSTSQDVVDSAMVLQTRRALALIDTDLKRLVACLLDVADRHRVTPMLGRTLMQPAQVISFGVKLVAWIAPLLRARERLRRAAAAALTLQLGGAVGTLSAMAEKGAAITACVAADLGVGVAPGPWHTQRDQWVALGCEIGLLCGSLGKVAKDISLLAQGEIGEVAEPSGGGRGGSSAMPHKRNPVASMVALAAAQRAPQRVATLLAAMPQEHERGLGNWQAELAEWPGLLACASGAARALAQAAAGLEVDGARMRRNIVALQGLVFSEDLATFLGPVLGKSEAQARVERWSQQTVAGGGLLREVAAAGIAADPALAAVLHPERLATLFDLDRAAQRAGAFAGPQLEALRVAAAALDPD